MERERLPNRRERETFSLSYRGRDFTAGISRFADGRVAEIFIATAKSGEDMQGIARDAAVTASLALQFGCPLDTLRAALTRDERGEAAGPLGALLDHIATMDGRAEP
jgi:hypothetical protein